MRVHPRFLFLHVPKTGGWTVRRILEAADLGELPDGVYQHSTWDDLRVEFSYRPLVFATVREPCAWYRSYLHYNTGRNGHPKATLSRVIGPWRLSGPGFKSALQRLLFPRGNIDHFPLLGLRSSVAIGELRRSGIGIYTWMLQTMLRMDPDSEDLRGRLFDVDLVIDTDALRTELPKLMARLELDLGTAMIDTPDDNRNATLAAADRDVFPMEGTTAEVFDDEMRAWVYDKEHRIVHRMGYTGPDRPAKNATLERP